jgi:hypothetical protein
MFRIAIIFLFAGTFGALLGGGLTDRLFRDDVALVAANDLSPGTAPIAWQAGSSMMQAGMKAPRHLAMLGTRKGARRAAAGMLVPVGMDDGLYDDITVAPRSHKLMISALHVSARMAVSGG